MCKDRILEEEKSRGGGFMWVSAKPNMAIWENGWLSGGSKVQTLSDLTDPHGAHPRKPIFSPQIQATVVLCKGPELFHDTQHFRDVRNEHQAGPCLPLSLSSCHPLLKTWSRMHLQVSSKMPWFLIHCLLLENLSGSSFPALTASHYTRYLENEGGEC